MVGCSWPSCGGHVLVRSLLAILMFRQQARPRFGSLDPVTRGSCFLTCQIRGRPQAGPGRVPRFSRAKVAPRSLRASRLPLYEAHRRNIASI